MEGTPDAGAPALTQNETVHELALAQVELANGYSTITEANITDERGDETLCGYFKYRAKPAWYPGGSMIYKILKRRIAMGDTASIKDAMDIFLAAGKLTKEQYDELTILLTV